MMNEDFRSDVGASIKDPLAKLLYAVLWKQGDLQKIKHVIKGIGDSDNAEQVLDEKAIVFRQFGRHLANKHQEPIVDQHVLRSYSVYITPVSDFEMKLTTNFIQNWRLVAQYKAWLAGLNKSTELNIEIDHLLFSLGKYIKSEARSINPMI